LRIFYIYLICDCQSIIFNFVKYIASINQIRLQLDDSCFFFTIGFAFFCKTTLIASSNIAFNPYCVKALHSIYLHLNSYSITFRAVYFIMGASLVSFFICKNSYRRSILLPTKILGTFPTFSCSSGYH